MLATLSQMQGVGHWKGVGKGGKGHSKGKGKGTDDNECYQCLWGGCVAAEQQLQTWSNKPGCFKCHRPHGTAVSPPLERMVVWAYQAKFDEPAETVAPGATKGKGKGKGKQDPTPNAAGTSLTAQQLADLRVERLAALKQARAPASAGASAASSASSSPATSPGAAKTAATKPTGKALQPSVLCESALDSAPLLTELIKPVIDLVAADWVAVVPKDLDPEEDLKALLQTSNHLSAVDEREALETCLEESRLLLESTVAPNLKKRIQEQFDADTIALGKIAKKTTSSLATQLAALEEAEKTLLKQASERKDKETVGRQKALARTTARREFFTDVRRQLEIVEAAVATHEEQSSSVHEAKSQVLDYHGVAMLAKLHTRIAAAENPLDPALSPQAPPDAAADGSKDVEMEELKRSLSASEQTAKDAAEAVAKAKATAESAAAEANAKQAELLKQIEDLRVTATQNESLQKQALATQQVERTFAEAEFAMIPKDVAPKTGEKVFYKICGHLYQLLERWHFGGTFPVTLEELASHSLAKDTMQGLMKKLLGAQLWKGWFGEENFTIVDVTSVLPRQTLMFLFYSLQQLKEHYSAVEDTKAAAAKSFAALLEAGTKRRRIAA